MSRQLRPLLTVMTLCLAMLLTGCALLNGGSSGTDREANRIAVQEALQGAVEALPEHIDGTVHFQDSGMTGTVINGVLIVAGDDRDEALASFTKILETTLRVYLEQSGVGTATVRLEARLDPESSMRLFPSDVLGLDEQRNVDSDELAEYFGLSS